MKKIALAILLAGSLAFTSCDLLTSLTSQVTSIANLVNCEFNLKNVNNVSVAGVNVKNLTSGDLSATDVVKLVAADGNDGTLERVLEEVVGSIAVLYQKKNVGIDIRLMPLEQNIERTIIAVFIQYDQLMVGHCRQIIHYVSNFGFGVMSFYRQSVLVRFIAV